jgi:hypothetical protein
LRDRLIKRSNMSLTYALGSPCHAPSTTFTFILTILPNTMAFGQLCQSSEPTWISQQSGTGNFPEAATKQLAGNLGAIKLIYIVSLKTPIGIESGNSVWKTTSSSSISLKYVDSLTKSALSNLSAMLHRCW